MTPRCPKCDSTDFDLQMYVGFAEGAIYSIRWVPEVVCQSCDWKTFADEGVFNNPALDQLCADLTSFAETVELPQIS